MMKQETLCLQIIDIVLNATDYVHKYLHLFFQRESV